MSTEKEWQKNAQHIKLHGFIIWTNFMLYSVEICRFYCVTFKRNFKHEIMKIAWFNLVMLTPKIGCLFSASCWSTMNEHKVKKAHTHNTACVKKSSSVTQKITAKFVRSVSHCIHFENGRSKKGTQQMSRQEITLSEKYLLLSALRKRARK